MTTLDITYPIPRPARRDPGALREVGRRLIPARGLGSARAGEHRSRPMRGEPTGMGVTALRWSRETDNPFDVPTSTYREAIP